MSQTAIRRMTDITNSRPGSPSSTSTPNSPPGSLSTSTSASASATGTGSTVSVHSVRSSLTRSPTPTSITMPESASASTSTSMPIATSASGSGSSSSTFLTPVTPQIQSAFLRSPSEIIQKVLATSGGEDVLAIARSAKACRELRSFIYETTDQALWRDIHLQKYDDPRKSGTFVRPRESTEIDWTKRVQDREFVRRLFEEQDEDRFSDSAQHFDLICSTLLDMYLDLPPLPNTSDTPDLLDDSANSTILVDYLSSRLFRYLCFNHSLEETRSSLRPLADQPTNPLRRSRKTIVNPSISYLHTLLPPEFDEDVKEDRRRRGYYREVVYSTKNYEKRNDWGPFTDDGKVDWTLVDAISSVMMANGKDVICSSDDHWEAAVQPMSYGIEPARGLGFNDLQCPPDLAEDAVWDWADVKGTWCGSYAFLDYGDWVTLNEPRLVILRPQVPPLDLSTYHEAVGDLMRLELVVTKEPSASTPVMCPAHHVLVDPLPAIKTNLPTSDLLPPIHFHGSSIQHQGGNSFPTGGAPSSSIRGVVRLTADDPPQVRWTLVIRYGGEDRWRLECVQVGGRGSKRGFFGVWTDALKEEHSPNGPVWYWKE